MTGVIIEQGLIADPGLRCEEAFDMLVGNLFNGDIIAEIGGKLLEQLL